MALDEPNGMTLRERKRRAARDALSGAAIRLAIERGLENVRVEDIAAEVGVSTRTFNNYFSSKEEAICAITVRRNARIGELLVNRPASEPIWEAVTNAVVEHFSGLGDPDREFIARFRLMAGNSSLRGEFLRAHGEVERVIAAAIAERTGLEAEELGPRLLAGTVASTMRIAMHHWLNSDAVVSLTELLRTALTEMSTGIPSLTAKSRNNDANHHEDREIK